MSWLMFSLAASSLWPRGLPKISGLNLALISRNYTTKMSSDSHWLPPADRDQHVMELRAAGWMEVEDRDAIFKELHFKTFNQTCRGFVLPTKQKVLRRLTIPIWMQGTEAQHGKLSFRLESRRKLGLEAEV
nr:pterin-4-alpha-carbinolamine dehydratase-like isoform X2 [Syngnathus scovelli]